MRIAISGTHGTGKSSLIDALAKRLPHYTLVEEPYHLMEEDGYEFSHPPSVEDFTAQLERSLLELRAGDPNIVFDRCPVDFLAYILAQDEDGFDVEEWLPSVREAVASLDLVVFVLLEARGRAARSAKPSDGASRSAVHAKFEELLLDDPFELGLNVLTVDGTTDERVQAVLERIAG